MVKKIFFNLFNSVFSTGFDNQKVRKHYLALDLVSGVCKNLKKSGFLHEKHKILKWYFHEEYVLMS